MNISAKMIARLSVSGRLSAVLCGAILLPTAFPVVGIAASQSAPLSAPLDAPLNVPATAPSSEPPTEFSDPPLVPSNIDSEADESEVDPTANYSDGEISLDYPATWEVEVDESGDLAIENVPVTPADLIETQLFRIDSPPGPLVNANIDSFIEEGSAVSRYRSVTIDQQSALVMWLADRPDELGSAIATFIGYGDRTIMLFSRYSPENLSAEDSILRLHSSVTNLAAVDPATETTESDAIEPDVVESEVDIQEADSSETEAPETDFLEME